MNSPYRSMLSHIFFCNQHYKIIKKEGLDSRNFRCIFDYVKKCGFCDIRLLFVRMVILTFLGSMCLSKIVFNCLFRSNKYLRIKVFKMMIVRRKVSISTTLARKMLENLWNLLKNEAKNAKIDSLPLILSRNWS